MKTVTFPALEHFQPERIGIFIFRQIGDVLLLTPMLRALRGKFPGAKITVFVNDFTAPMLENNPDVNQVIPIARNPKTDFAAQFFSAMKLWRQIWRAEFDLTLDFTGGDRPAFYSWISGARVRLALWTAGGFLGWKNRAYTSWIPRPEGELHQVERHLQLLKPFGMETQRAPKLRLNLTDEELDWAKRQRKPADKKIVVAHFVANWLFKCWDDEKAAELMDRLQENGTTVWFTSGPAPKEMEKARRILALCRKKPQAWLGDISLRQLAALIAVSDVFVGVDTAPLHIAAALDIPIVALFGPTLLHQWRPWSEQATVLTAPCHCRIENKKLCPHNGLRDCLANITVEEVETAVNDSASRF